jgi:basic membrane lipoprotein Med (substrate-binding protein (PBP1-ABC) superfamily)
VKYVYAEDGADQDAVYKTASDMYGAGTEVILAGGSDIQEPVIEAAEAKDGKVIGSGTDQSAKSDTVITSAIYNINTALKEVLNDYEGKEFPGGEVQNYNAYNNGIGLELKNNKLNVLTQKQYDTVFDELADGSIKINTDKIESVQDLKTTNVTIE